MWPVPNHLRDEVSQLWETAKGIFKGSCDPKNLEKQPVGAENSWERKVLSGEWVASSSSCVPTGTGRITHLHQLQRCQTGCEVPHCPPKHRSSWWRLPHLCSSSLKVLTTQNRAGQGLDFFKYFPKPGCFSCLLSPVGCWVVCLLGWGLPMGGPELKGSGLSWQGAELGFGVGPRLRGSFPLQEATKSSSDSNHELGPSA